MAGYKCKHEIMTNDFDGALVSIPCGADATTKLVTNSRSGADEIRAYGGWTSYRNFTTVALEQDDPGEDPGEAKWGHTEWILCDEHRDGYLEYLQSDDPTVDETVVRIEDIRPWSIGDRVTITHSVIGTDVAGVIIDQSGSWFNSGSKQAGPLWTIHRDDGRKNVVIGGHSLTLVAGPQPPTDRYHHESHPGASVKCRRCQQWTDDWRTHESEVHAETDDMTSEVTKMYVSCRQCGEVFDDLAIAHGHAGTCGSDQGWDVVTEEEAF